MSLLAMAALLLALAAASVSSFGVLMARDVFDRLHFLGPVTVVATPLIFLAVLLQEGWSPMTGKVAIVMLTLLLTAPVVTHAIARAALVRGDARRLRDERWKVSE